MLIDRLKKSVPFLVAGVLALNGFLTLAAGLAEVFGFDFRMERDLGQVSGYLNATPAARLGGFVSVLLGALLLVLGKGLAERRSRAWWTAIAVLALILITTLYHGVLLGRSGVTLVLLGLLLGFRREFGRQSDPWEWTYGEVVAAMSVLFALGYGIVGSYLLREEFSALETWTDAVYFTIVTYSTLGYGDILPTTSNAKIFTVTMVLVGLSSFVTALTVLLRPLVERRMREFFSVMTKFQSTDNHVVVCGFTKVTESIIHELNEREIPFLIIEDRDDMCTHLKGLGYQVVAGNPAERRTLERANLSQALAVIAATDSDATNTLVALTARELRERGERRDFRIVVRIEDEENIAKVQRVGADEIVSPSTLGGRQMAGLAAARAGL
jgi:voltage-gated potassium channel